ncbi:MAG: hypothetical protein ABI565_09425, partial [Vicinamibacteria bacterium]
DRDVFKVDEERDALFFGCVCGQGVPEFSGFAEVQGVWQRLRGSRLPALFFEGGDHLSPGWSGPRVFVIEAAVARAVRCPQKPMRSGSPASD